MMDLLKYANARLGEASTWSAITALLIGLHLSVDPGLMHTITIYVPIVTGLLGVVIADAENKKPPAAIAEDVLGALARAIITQPAPAAVPVAPPAPPAA